jgi:putative membrane protein
MTTMQNKSLKNIILVICILVPVLVAVIALLPKEYKDWGVDTSFLTGLNAIINSTTAVLLVLAVIAVKKKKFDLHKKMMLTALGLGAVFLLSYVLYHATNESVKFGDINHDGAVDVAEKLEVGVLRLIYLVVLFSHILLSIVVLPFVLFAVYAALSEDFQKHKRLVRFAFPVWLYISVTGVLVYVMIYPYYV